VLSAKVPVAVLLDVLQQVQAAGLHEVELEVWESRYAEGNKPTHNLRLAEVFRGRQAGGQQQAKPQPQYVSHEELNEADSYPF